MLNYNDIYIWFYQLILNNSKNSFIFIIFITIIFNKFKNKNLILLFFSVLLLFNDYSYECNYYAHLYRNVLLNTTLINGLILVHPVLTYCTYIYYIVFLNKLNFLRKYNYTIFYLSTGAMVLGG